MHVQNSVAVASVLEQAWRETKEKAGKKAPAAVKHAFKDESARGKRGAHIPAGEIAEALGVPADYPDLPDPDVMYALRKGKLVMIHDKKLIQIPPTGLNFADDPGI